MIEPGELEGVTEGWKAEIRRSLDAARTAREDRQPDLADVFSARALAVSECLRDVERRLQQGGRRES